MLALRTLSGLGQPSRWHERNTFEITVVMPPTKERLGK